MKNKIARIYFVLLALFTALMIAGLLYGNINVYSMGGDRGPHEIIPIRQETTSINRKEYYLDLSNEEYYNDTLEIYSEHEEIRVYADDELIYAYENPYSIFGDTTGAKYSFVKLPPNASDIRVEVVALYEENLNYRVQLRVGNGLQMHRQYLIAAFPATVVSILCIFIGALLVGYWGIASMKAEIASAPLYFGVFAVMLGLWTFHETDFATLMVGNRTVASFCAYILLMLMLVPFVLFVRSYMETTDKYFATGVCSISILNMVVNTAGHMLGFWYLKKTAILTYLCIALALVYLVHAVVQRYKKFGFDSKLKVNVVGLVVLILSLLVSVLIFYLDPKQTDIVGKIGLLLYIGLLGAHTTVEFFAKVDEGRKVEIYKELARRDRMTGLYNRNAFEEWESTCRDYDNIMLVTFDLNNLKKCNDIKGHEVGDKYIIDSAELIQRVFQKNGNCYRIGGDEFCVVVECINGFDVEACLTQLKELQNEYNEISEDVDMQISFGYALFDPEDIDIEGTRSRADARMYAYKRESKSVRY